MSAGCPEKSTLLDLLAPARTAALSDALDLRGNILALTQETEEAVLTPQDPGGWTPDLRAALSARVAALNGALALFDRYRALISDPHIAKLADPAETGSALGLDHVCAFMDKVTAKTREVEAADITALQDKGVSDADIVRLCEINAFMSYQVRVFAGLQLLKGMGA